MPERISIISSFSTLVFLDFPDSDTEAETDGAVVPGGLLLISGMKSPREVDRDAGSCSPTSWSKSSSGDGTADLERGRSSLARSVARARNVERGIVTPRDSWMRFCVERTGERDTETETSVSFGSGGGGGGAGLVSAGAGPVVGSGAVPSAGSGAGSGVGSGVGSGAGFDAGSGAGAGPGAGADAFGGGGTLTLPKSRCCRPLILSDCEDE